MTLWAAVYIVIGEGSSILVGTVKPLIRDTPKEDKPPNKGPAKSTHVYMFYLKVTFIEGYKI